MVGDDEETIMEEMKLICDLRKVAMEEEVPEEEVLQTKIVSQREVSKEWEKWKMPAEDEIQALLNEKEAMRSINKQQLEEMIRVAEERGPSKLVFTKKPGKNGGKRKIRWVICGNYESRSDQESNFSSGADSTAFCVMLVMCPTPKIITRSFVDNAVKRFKHLATCQASGNVPTILQCHNIF